MRSLPLRFVFECQAAQLQESPDRSSGFPTLETVVLVNRVRRGRPNRATKEHAWSQVRSLPEERFEKRIYPEVEEIKEQRCPLEYHYGMVRVPKIRFHQGPGSHQDDIDPESNGQRGQAGRVLYYIEEAHPTHRYDVEVPESSHDLMATKKTGDPISVQRATRAALSADR